MKNKLLFRVMRLLVLFWLVGFMHVSATIFSQTVTLKGESLELATVFNAVRKQTGLGVYGFQSMFRGTRPVNVDVKEMPLDQFLLLVLNNQPLEASVQNRTIVIRRKNNHGTPARISQNFDGIQERTITGRVTDEQDNPLAGVTVSMKGTPRAVTTDDRGQYQITALGDENTLVFSSVGFSVQERSVASQSVIHVVLKVAVGDLDEVIVVGYGVQKKKDMTGAIHRLDASKFDRAPNTNLLEMLNGTVAGFYSNQGTSAQGGGSMLIRGETSLKASNSPLIVLDGVIFNGILSDINPMDIANIDILKDASAAAVFGARSASGVVIVTTKRGQSGSPAFSFTSKLGVASKTGDMRPFNAQEYLYNRGVDSYQTYRDRPLYYYQNPLELPEGVTLEQWKNLDPTPSDDVVDMWLNRLKLTNTEKKNYLNGKVTDWFDVIFRNGFRQDYDVSVSGTGNASYFVSAGYTDNKGIVIGDNFTTFRTRLNLDLKATSFLSFAINTSFANRNHGFVQANIYEAVAMSPYGEIYDDSGKMTWFPHEDATYFNPLLYHTYTDKYNPVQSLFSTVSAELKLPFNIVFRPLFTSNQRWVKDFTFDPMETYNGFNNNGYGRRSVVSYNEWMLDNVLSWNGSLHAKHQFNATFLFNLEKNRSWSDVMSNIQFSPNDVLSYHSLQSGVSPAISNNDMYSTGSALMGRVNYNFDERYLLTGTIRRDGYSAFGQNEPYAVFPSVAAAWRLSNEAFFKLSWVDDLKLRFSWGVNGNRDIGVYDALARLSTSNYVYGTTPVTGVYSNTMENRGLKWERTASYNAGVDFTIFKNRISGSVDAYTGRTHDLLVNRTLPTIIGYSAVTANLGLLENKGLELTLLATPVDRGPKFTWNTTFNFALNRNKILSLYGDFIDVFGSDGNVIGRKEADDVSNSWFIGKSIHEIWDYERQGIWQLDEATEAAKYGKTPGDVKLKDQSGDGVLTPMEDRIFMGSKVPLYSLGFRNEVRFLNDFELSVFIRADLGHFGNNDLYRSTSWIDRRNIYAAPYWTEDNPSNEYPKLRTEVNNPAFGVWVTRSFIRLQDITLAYNVPSNALRQLKINSLSLYANLRNAFTISKWNHWDPESHSVPMPRLTTVGVTLNF